MLTGALVPISLSGATPATPPEAASTAIDIEWLSTKGIGQSVAPDQTGVEVAYTLNGKQETTFLPVEADTHLWKNSPASQGEGTGLILRDGRYSEGLIRLNVEALPKEAQIVQASLRLKVITVENKGQAATLACYRVLTPWTENATWAKPRPGEEATWNGLQSGKDFEAAPFTQLAVPSLDHTQKGGQILTISGFAEAVRQWRDGAWSNEGFLLVLNGKAMQTIVPSREAAANSKAIQIGGPDHAEALLAINQPLLAQLALQPDDLLEAQAKLKVLKVQPTPGAPSEELKIYGVHGDDEAALAKRELLASVPLKSVPPMGELLLPDVSAALRTWMKSGDASAKLLLTIEGGNGSLHIGGAANRPAMPFLTLRIKAHEAARLFDIPVRPKSGVYAKVVDGHLNYDGQRLRLWGVVGHPVVDRLAKLGFNAQRVWQPSANLGSGKTYSDESAQRGEFAPYTPGDGSELDVADKQFGDLKAHGMFVMFAALADTTPIEPLYQDGSFISGGDDWAQWKEAMQVKGAGNPGQYLFVDERLQKSRYQHAKNLLTHRNSYTGKTYGEEENIAIYEVANENGFVFRTLNGSEQKWPPYFKNKLQARWNDWLKKRYASEEALLKAWGKVDAGESLGQGTIKLGPDFEDRLKYPEQRANDYVHCVIDIANDFNQKFRTYCRSLVPEGTGVNVVPFSFDTMFRPNLPWAYGESLGDVVSFGMYYWDLKSSLDKAPSSYLIDSFTPDRQPVVLYETNIGRPNPYRSEYPIKLAAMASRQDWDGVFWHYWSKVEGEGDLPYLNNVQMPPISTHYWTAVQHQTDPVMNASMALGGRIFLGGMIPPAEAPQAVKVDGKGVFSYDFFRGVNLAQSTFSRGSRIQYQTEKSGGSEPVNVMPPSQRLDRAIAAGQYVTWDWPNGRLIIDAPNVKAYVGRTNGMFRFSDGITLGNVSTPWVAFILESSDGKPLTGPGATSRALMGAYFDAKNTDFSFDYNVVGGPMEQARAVRNIGRLPVLVDRVEYTVWFPRQLNGVLKDYDFALREIHSAPLVKENRMVQTGPTPFLTALEISSWGDDATLPVAQATKIDTQQNVGGSSAAVADATASMLKSSDLIHPIPGMDWTMDYATAHKLVENSTLIFTTFTDTADAAKDVKTIAISDLQLPAMWKSAVDAVVTFHASRMAQVDITFKEPPPIEELVTKVSTLIGDPAEKKIDTQYGTTRIVWKGRGAAPDVVATESQGILKLLYKPQG